MPPSFNFIELPPNSTGLKVDTAELTNGANTVEREILVLGDPSTAANVAGVTAAGALKTDASATTQPVSWSGQTVSITDPANGSTGSAVPSTAVYVGGNKGGNLTGLALDGSGNLDVNINASSATVPVSGTFWQTTQPVSGTITANQGTANTAANSWQVEVTDGTNVLGVSAHPLRVDPTGTTTQPVSLTSTTITGTVAVTESGTWTNRIVGNTGATLDAATGAVAPTNTLQVGGSDGTDLRVLATDSGGQVKVLVENTPAVTLTSTTVTNTVTTSDVADGSTGSAVPAKAVYVGGNEAGNLVGLALDGSGNLKVNVAAGGASGGTSSSFGATFPGTGTAAGASDGTNMQPLLVDGSGFLKVNVSAGSSGNAAASATGSAVPASGDYQGINVGGTLRGVTGNSTSTSGAYAQDTNIVSILGTAPTTVGKLDVKGADGDVFVRQATGTNLHVVVDTAPTTAVTQSGTWSNRIVGNSGATLDATVGAGTAPANGLAVIAQYNTTLPAPTNGQTTVLQTDQNANLLTFPSVQFETGAVWNSSSALNTLQYSSGTSTPGRYDGPLAVLVQLDQSSGTFSGGVVTFQGTYDNTNWVTIPVAQVLNPQTYAQLTNPYTFVTNTNTPFLILLQGMLGIRLNLTTQITGTGTVTPYWTKLSTLANLPAVVTQATAANLNATVVPGGSAIFEVSPTTAANTSSNAFFNQLVPGTAGGCSTAVSQALTTTINVKASAGQLYGYMIYNPNASAVYVEYYNTATTPGTIGSTTNLLLEFAVPATGAANVFFDAGVAFGSGIAVAVATTATGNTAPGTGLTITTIYK